MRADSTIDRYVLGELLGALDRGGRGRALHSPDRYALQLTTTGSDPADALLSVLSRWTDAVRQLGLPRWEVVRTEVLRPKELTGDLQTVEAVRWHSPPESLSTGVA